MSHATAKRTLTCRAVGIGDGLLGNPTLTAWVLAVVVALAAAGAPGRPALAQEADPGDEVDREWRMTSFEVGHGNDILGMVKSKRQDDNGFTASGHLAAKLSDGDREALRIDVRMQMITEREGLDRVDEGRITAAWERFLGSSAADGLTVGWTLGVEMIGNLGGSVVQDWSHHTVFTGRFLSGKGVKELQYRYPDRYDVLAMFGGSVTFAQPLVGSLSLREGMSGLAGFGTGVYAELHPFVAIGLSTRRVDLELRQGAGIYATDIRALTMPGGYVTGVLANQPSARIRLSGPGLRTYVSLEWELNHGGSHQHVGEVNIGARF